MDQRKSDQVKDHQVSRFTLPSSPIEINLGTSRCQVLIFKHLDLLFFFFFFVKKDFHLLDLVNLGC